MQVRSRDIKKPEPKKGLKKTTPTTPRPDPRIDSILKQLFSLQEKVNEVSVDSAHAHDERMNFVVDQIGTMKKQLMASTATASEWVFEVERGRHNEIKTVTAKRRLN